MHRVYIHCFRYKDFWWVQYLEVLMRRCKAVVPHAMLINEGWGSNTDVSFESL